MGPRVALGRVYLSSIFFCIIGHLLCNILFYMVFGHKRVLPVCEHNQPTMIQSTIFLSPLNQVSPTRPAVLILTAV